MGSTFCYLIPTHRVLNHEKRKVSSEPSSDTYLPNQSTLLSYEVYDEWTTIRGILTHAFLQRTFTVFSINGIPKVVFEQSPRKIQRVLNELRNSNDSVTLNNLKSYDISKYYRRVWYEAKQDQSIFKSE